MGDRYRLKRRLARGGMAEVYLAEVAGAEGFSQTVALKRILPHLAADERVVRMFVAEAKLATHLHHQNIVQVLDVGRGAQGLFIAMELVDGWDLAQVSAAAAQAQRAFPPPLVAFIASQALTGLSFAYRRRVGDKPILAAHRDVSPSNVLLSREGEVKVADFGIAKLNDEQGLTEPGTFKGKLAYAAPEILHGEPATHASDEFSLGVTLYELLARKHPYGDPATPAKFIFALQERAPAALPGLPPGFWETIARMLKPAPAERFVDTEGLLQTWTRLATHGGTPVTSRALAAFLSTLSLPPSTRQLGDEPVTADFSLSGAAWLGAGIEAPSGWRPVGPQLDASGRLVASAQAAPPPAPAPPPPAPRLGAEAELEVGSHSAGWQEAPLELAYQRAPDPLPPPLDDGPRAVRRPRWILGVLALVAAGVTGAWFAPQIIPRLSQWAPSLPRRSSGTHTLNVVSQPSGATVRVNGQALGVTPLFLDNLYAPGAIPFELSLPGYKPWRGEFQGGEEARIEARLVKRP